MSSTTTSELQVGPELRAARERTGLSRERVAALSSCSVSWLTALEKGQRPDSSAALGRIWRVLHALGEHEHARGGGPLIA